MATPMTSNQFIAQLKKWGVNYREYRDWETHNRNHKGPWGPVNGVMWHHTGNDNADQRELLYNGYTELPGPLCHGGIAQNGTVWLIGWGRVNHAGLGDDDVLNAVINETDAPVDDESNTDGNRHFYGFEFWYSGSHAMTEAQVLSGVLVSCAILDFYNWNENSVIGHGEWQPGKWDPGYKPGTMMNMDAVRTAIATRLQIGPNPVGTPAPIPGQNIAEESDATYQSVWKTDAMRKPSTSVDNPDNQFWEAETMFRYAAEQAALANQKADKIMQHLGIE
jgi:hypothetical protein